MRRSALGALVIAVLVLGGVGVAHADADIEPLDPEITPLSKNITPMETVAQDAGTTSVSLQTDILFGFGESALSDDARARIGEIVADIPRDVEVEVQGHTDSIPFSRGNQTLSEERAQAVADAVVGARPDLRLKVSGYGDSRPVAAEPSDGTDDPDARAANRRVEIRYGS